MRHERWSAAQYREALGLSHGASVPQSPLVRKSILTLTKPEREYAHFLEYEKLAGRVIAYWPQPFTLRLPGWRQTYRPDFLVQLNHASMTFHEKGFTLTPCFLQVVEIKTRWKSGKVGWQPDAREKFKTAAGIYTCFAWVVRWKDANGCWQEERFT